MTDAVQACALSDQNSTQLHSFRKRHATTLMIAGSLAIGAALTPLAMIQTRQIPGFMLVFGAAMVVINVVLAAILFSRGAIEGRGDINALGAAYLFVGLIFLPLAASFPGGSDKMSLIGSPATSVWLWLFWHAGFAVAILNYVRIAGQATRRPASVGLSVIAVLLVVTILAVASTSFITYFPPALRDGRVLFSGAASMAPLAVLALLVAATIFVARLPRGTQEHLPLTVAMTAACLDVWLSYQGQVRFSVGWYLAKCASLLTSLTVLIALLHEINILYSRAARANGVLEDLARHDAMTALLNRRGLDEAVDREWRRAQRESTTLSVVMIDVDHFKRFNDRYGHSAGDECLRQVAGALLTVIRRPADSAARYGGEEFALLLPRTDRFGAADIARRLRAALAALAIPHADSPEGVISVSMGIASIAAIEPGGGPALLTAADQALYAAKNAGRNAICSAVDGLVSNSPALPQSESDPAPQDGTTPAFATIPPGLPPNDQTRLPRLAGNVPTAIYALQCEVLEAVASGQTLRQVIRLLCSKVGQVTPGVVCAVTAIDETNHLRHLADSGLPVAFTALLDGLDCSAHPGWCDAMATSGTAEETLDIDADPAWTGFKAPLLAAGLRACWSSPVTNGAGRRVGTFACYYPSQRSATAFERDVVETCIHLVALAIDREGVWTQLHEANKRFDAALSNMTQGLCFFAGDRLVVANRRYSEIYHLDPNRVVPGVTLADIVAMRVAAGTGPTMPAQDYLQWRQEVQACETAMETTVELADGRSVAIRHQSMPNDEWVSTHDDVTERRLTEDRLVHAARHDTLTGLPNRVLFEERVQLALALSGRGPHCAVLCLDLDNFKAINDSYGRHVGDRLLMLMAERLQACVREIDTVARMGSDEFAILTVGPERPEDAAELAKRIVRALSHSFELDAHQITVATSIGIAMAPADGAFPSKLLQSADTALYRTKCDQRGTYRFFEPEMDARLQLRFELERDLRVALQNQEFELVYQAVYNLATDTISGFEALLRWRHPTRGFVSPADFIPLAEETGLIVPLGAWVLQQACAEAVTWPKPVKVAVNLSGIQLKTAGLVATVKHALATSGLPPVRLELEITESVLLTNNADTVATLHALRDLGISVAMDDFGTGYSSLSYLRSFPFDKIKIDQSFIRDLTERDDCVAIIRAVVGLGRSMGMLTTAEGVETQAQLSQLREEGCSEIQGYLLSRPIPPEAARALLCRDDSEDRVTTRSPIEIERRLFDQAGLFPLAEGSASEPEPALDR